MEYRGRPLRLEFVIDLIVNETVLIEVKAVERLLQVFEAQTITYLKLTGCPVGLLINFNVPLVNSGVRRLVHPNLYRRRFPVLEPHPTNE